MKCGTGAALAIGAGYVLGRRRKMRTAAVIAGATAVGGIGGLGGSVLRRGVNALGSTDLLGNVAPQLGEIADTVRGDLLDAAKAAAVAALTGRIESLADSLHERAGAPRDPAGQAEGAAEQFEDSDEFEDSAEFEDSDELEDADEPEAEEPEPAPEPRRARRDRPVVSRARR
jgi:hypothetical protein